MSDDRAPRKRPDQRDVVLVGGGHAHVQVLRDFAMAAPQAARLTLVVDRPMAVYSGMVPGFVAGHYRVDELEIDVVPLARRAGARVILSPAAGIDPRAKRVLLADRPSIPYDVAAFDIGSTVAGLDLPGIREHALPTRPIGALVAGVSELIDRAGRHSIDRPFSILVVGGGAGGVELAFTLTAGLEARAMRSSVLLLESSERILGGFPRSLARRAERHARRLGIDIRTGVEVIAAEPDAVRLRDGERLPCHGLVWVTGAVAHGLLRDSGLRCDERGFVRTRSTLQVEGHDEIFAVGDCATLTEFPRTPKAGVYAVRQGPVLTDNLKRFLAGRPLRRYRPQRDFLTLLNLGTGSALGAKWGASFEGRWAMRLKDSIDRRFMRRFQVLDRGGRPASGFSNPPPMAADRDPPCGGCAAKLGRRPLARVLDRLPPPPDEPAIELGLSAPDDAAVWPTASGGRIASSVDLFAAFTDDPYLVGRVAAINALSDLWAKGVEPRVAQAVVALPEELDRRQAEETLLQVLAGVRRELDPLTVALAGGHTTLAPERLLVGLAVEGELAAGQRLLRKGGLCPGDALVLSKALGTGVLFYADMRGRAAGAWISAAIASMLRPNRHAGQVAADLGASAVTDVTGFGLAGHLLEMLTASGVSADVDLDSLPALPGALELLAQGARSTLHAENTDLGAAVELDGEVRRDPRRSLLFDPQTSGGLLFGVAAARALGVVSRLQSGGDTAAAIIGRVAGPAADGRHLRVRVRPAAAIAPGE